MTKLRKFAVALRTIVLMLVLLTAVQLVSAPSNAAADDPDWGVEFRTWYFDDSAHTTFIGYFVYNTCTGVETGEGEHSAYFEQIYDDIRCD
jgi:hypothetical protein